MKWCKIKEYWIIEFKRAEMSVNNRLTQTLRNAKIIPFDLNSKFVFFSDCHRGVNDWADDFAHNQTIFFHALQSYNREKFTYVEVGDGDEMWENKQFMEIRKSHSHIFWELSKFYHDGRFLMLYGNHDIEKRDRRVVRRNLHSYLEDRSGERKPLFPGITVHESLLLKPVGGGKSIFVLHGHQADPINDRYWRLGKFLCRNFWKPLQLLGIKDRTSPAQNFYKRNKVEKRLINWTRENNLITIAGHTHRSRFPDKFDTPYYNDGSGVHPRCITGIEISQGEIVLVKWAVACDLNGALYIQRSEIEGPRRLIGS
jgi:UDP-2,3-diacylglucosamine pyrophosphatase LpxH